MKLSLPMTGRVKVSREFRSEVHSDPASLPVKSAHRQIIGTRINIRPDRKCPAPSYSRHLQVVGSRLRKFRKVRGLNRIPGIRIECRRTAQALERRCVVRSAFYCECGGCGCVNHRYFRCSRQVPNLVDLDPHGPVFPARSTSNRSVKEKRQQDGFSDQGGKARALLTGGFRHASSSVSPKDAKCRPTPPPAASVPLFLPEPCFRSTPQSYRMPLKYRYTRRRRLTTDSLLRSRPA